MNELSPICILVRTETRLQWKKRVLRGMADLECSEDEIVDVFRFLDLVMTLPPNLEGEFQEFLADMQEDRRMPFLSSYERKAMAKGKREGKQEGVVAATRRAVLDALEVRFSRTPTSVQKQLQQLDDPTLLKDLHRRAITVETLAEFTDGLPHVRQAA